MELDLWKLPVGWTQQPDPLPSRIASIEAVNIYDNRSETEERHKLDREHLKKKQ